MRILVTGGAGFIGRRLAALIAPARHAAVVDDLSIGLSMPEPAPRLTCHRADVRDAAAMTEIMKTFAPDVVVHMAALHHIPSCEGDPRRTMDVNVTGFQTVLDVCARTGCTRVVLASSGAVYDWSDGTALAESAPIRPRDVYSVSKTANEHQLATWTVRTGGSGAIARLFNVVGPGDPNGHLIPDILGRLSSAGTSPARLRLGNIESRRDLVDVQDAAGCLLALVERGPWRAGETDVFNICSGTEYTVPDIVRRLAACLDVEAMIFTDPTLRRAIDRPSQLGDPTKTMRELGWRAQRSLDDSLHAIAANWLQRAC